MSNLGPFQFRTTWYAWAPPWLSTGNGELYMGTLETCRDLLCEKQNEAIQIRIPGQGDPSQIPFLAHDRALQQGPGEPNDQFIQRLITAFAAWGRAGSRIAILEQLQAYLENQQPGVTETLPEIAIVGGCYDPVTTWDVVYFDTPSIALEDGVPAKTTVMPSNFNWDGKSIPWRSWLILYMALVPTSGLSGSAAATSTAAAGSYASPGQNVGGVWVPATSGTPVNDPWLTIMGLTNLGPDDVGSWLTLSGSSNPGNNGTFPIAQVLSPSACVIANPAGVTSDAGPLTWSVGTYPYIGPGPAWGSPGYLFGQGQLSVPPLDTGSNVGGVWQPTTLGSPSVISWGLDVAAAVIQSIRGLLRQWKSASTWYHDIIICFDGGSGVAGDAYSPLSSPGSGNPDGTFGGHGKNVAGVWVPNRLISSPFDAYCQGTAFGYYVN